MRRLLLLIALAACHDRGPAALVPGEAGSAFRPAEAPDFVVLSVSGRTIDFLSPFCPPECNEPYLGAPGDAAEAVALDLVDRGYSVQRADYIAALFSYDDDADGEADRLGFLQLVEDLNTIGELWIEGFDDPTRIVLVCHSHGCVWGHMAVSVTPDVPVWALVSLAGVCTQGESDCGAEVGNHFAANGTPYAWDLADPCAQWTIPGLADPADTDDVTFPSAATNLEVRANARSFGIQDTAPNHRPDGTREGIETLDPGEDDHSQVHDPARTSMRWVRDRILARAAP